MKDEPDKKRRTEKSGKEQLHTRAFQSNPTAISIVRVSDGVIIDINESFASLLGFSRDEMIGKTSADFDLYPNPEQRVSIIDQLKKRGRIRDYELILKSRTGRIINSIFSADIVTIEDCQYYLSSFVDISHSRKIEWELRNSENQFRVLIENLHSAVALVDGDGTFIIVNQSFLEMFDIEKDSDIMNVNSLDWSKWQVFHEDGTLLDVDEHPVRKVMKTGKGFKDNLVALKTPKGKDLKWMLISAEPILNHKDEIHQLICTYYDITALKRVEDDLKLSREKLNIALENGNIGVWEWDLSTNKVEWDDRIEKMFGLAPGSFGGTYSDVEHLIHDEDLDHVRKSINEAIHGDKPLETIFRTKSEEDRTRYITSKALLRRDDLGNAVAMTGVSFDVTDLREGTERIISKLNEDLLRSNRELESFAYVASHDLQEPLRMISSFTQLLQKRYRDKLDDTANEYIHFAVDGAKRMHDLINGLLQYSRIQRKAGEFSVVDMNKVVDRLKHIFKLALREKEIELVSETTFPKVSADEYQMQQLLQNLIGNAIKFSNSNKSIFVGSEIDKRSHVFYVRDEGIGIEPQYFEKIFQIFQRLMPKDQYDGTGIGLAVCKRIVERHGGKIWVESEPGKGSTFRFSLPKQTGNI